MITKESICCIVFILQMVMVVCLVFSGILTSIFFVAKADNLFNYWKDVPTAHCS